MCFSERCLVVLVISCSLLSSSVDADDDTKVLESGHWELITFPARTLTQPLGILLGDDLPLDTYRSDWTVFRYEPDTGSYAQPMLDWIPDIGEGIWIIQMTGARVLIDVPIEINDINAFESEACGPERSCIVAALPSTTEDTRWSIVGSPFAESTALTEFSIASVSTGEACNPSCSLGEAVANEVIHDVFYTYDSDTQSYSALSSTEVIDMWEGFWIMTLPGSNLLELLIPSRASHLNSQEPLVILGAMPSSVEVNSQTTVMFSVRWLDFQAAPVAIHLEAVKNEDRSLKNSTALLDDGMTPDLIAGDRVFSANVLIESSSEGELHFRARADLGDGSIVLSEMTRLGVSRFPADSARPPTEEAIVSDSDGSRVLSNRLLMSFDNATSPDQIASIVDSIGGTVVGSAWDLGLYQVEVAPQDAEGIKGLAGVALDIPGVANSESVGIGRLLATTPNDPMISRQWHLPRTSARNAWDTVTGKATIAIIDSGIDYNHEDLASKYMKGINYTVSKTHPDRNDPFDRNGHGTFVAGIAAASTNNAKGIAGVSWNSKVLAFNICPSMNYCAPDLLAFAIRDAVVMGAKVINMSIGVPKKHQDTLEKSIRLAESRRVVLVAAAGNSGKPECAIPARHPSVISVGATDKGYQRGPTSNYGPCVDIAAPGIDIFSTALSAGGNNSRYISGSGTSFSAPQVSGAAALLLERFPSWTPKEIREHILNNADPLLDESPPKDFGYGQLNLWSIMREPKKYLKVTYKYSRFAAYAQPPPGSERVRGIFDIVDSIACAGPHYSLIGPPPGGCDFQEIRMVHRQAMPKGESTIKSKKIPLHTRPVTTYFSCATRTTETACSEPVPLYAEYEIDY